MFRIRNSNNLKIFKQIRLLLSPDNELYSTVKFHYLDGKTRVCPGSFEKYCPVCKYMAEAENSLKYLIPTYSLNYGNIFNRLNQQNEVLLWDHFVHQKIIRILHKNGDITDPLTGRDLFYFKYEVPAKVSGFPPDETRYFLFKESIPTPLYRDLEIKDDKSIKQAAEFIHKVYNGRFDLNTYFRSSPDQFLEISLQRELGNKARLKPLPDCDHEGFLVKTDDHHHCGNCGKAVGFENG